MRLAEKLCAPDKPGGLCRQFRRVLSVLSECNNSPARISHCFGREVARPHGVSATIPAMKRLALLLLLVFAARACAATPRHTLVGQVVKIADGDTLTVLASARNQHKIRLAGIDAPEKAQAFGTQARNALAAAVFRQTVRVDVTDTDRYGREVGRVFCAGRFINAVLVRAGFA